MTTVQQLVLKVMDSAFLGLTINYKGINDLQIAICRVEMINLGNDIQVPECVYTYKDENYAGNYFMWDTL